MHVQVEAASIVCLITTSVWAAAVGTESSFGNRSHESLTLSLSGQLSNGATLLPLGQCPVTTSGTVRCADLVVPERRDLSTSRNITVRVAVLDAPEEDRQPDPFVFLMGGQGQGFGVLDQISMLPQLLKRDVITLQQRGTQLADPFFGCPSIENRLDDIDRNYVSQPTSPHPEQIELCKAEIENHAIDKNGYSTGASADDLWDLKQLLEVRDWNIFGVSYGGRTAQSFLRKHPDSARTLILDSPQITGIPFIFGYARLDKIAKFFSACATAPGCGAVGGSKLKAAFERTVDRLLSSPAQVLVAGRAQSLTARAYMHLVTWILYTRSEHAVHALPAAILAADDEDYAQILGLDGRYAEIDFETPWKPGDYPAHLGDHIAQQTGVLCSEEYPPIAWSDQNITISLAGDWTEAVRLAAEYEQQEQAEVCRDWEFSPSDPEQGQLPPINDIPTLIVHGDHDTIAPSEDGDVLGRRYSNSTRVVFRWTGHGIIERRKGCFLPMLRDFVTFPRNSINSSCATQIQEPRWLASYDRSTDGYLSVMENIISNQVQDFSFPGTTVYLDLHRANVSGTVAVGLANPLTGQLLTGREPSRMASMTKTYTAAAILRLFEQGQLLLDAGIDRYLTNQTAALLVSGSYRPDNISIRHLLHHTSGLPNYDDAAYQQHVLEDPQRQWTRREQLQVAMDKVISPSPPGIQFAYSDTGYILLGEVIEQVSGSSQSAAYQRLLRFDELGLRHTWFDGLDSAPADLPDRAHQYFGTVDVTEFNPSFDLFGGGGLVSTVEDEAKFLRSLMTGHVFERAETLSLMLQVPDSNSRSSETLRTGYAMGIASFLENADLCWGHTGFWGTSFAYCPSQDVVVATDRYQGMEPAAYYDSMEILRTALQINRLVLHPADSIR